ncbi:MAG: DUF1028 domain-containing protein, partial [Ignavibacteria bacterium]|nr:DUF1028 domain-containing protein [Ignavibacteria bacterium]
QSFWNASNQNYARSLMNTGHSPEQIIDSLVAHDAQGNPSIRQYGVVDLEEGGRSAGFTGVNCFDYKNHMSGSGYTVAGNILLGQEILDSMEVRFLTTPGILADRLMAALQGAKVPGADTRCLAGGRSSISAFIRVAQPGDTTGTLFLDLNVNNAPADVDPIDSLQVLFDEWRGGVSAAGGIQVHLPVELELTQNYPNPFNPTTTISFALAASGDVRLSVFDLLGREIAVLVDDIRSAGRYEAVWDAAEFPSGVYIYRVETSQGFRSRKMILIK